MRVHSIVVGCDCGNRTSCRHGASRSVENTYGMGRGTGLARSRSFSRPTDIAKHNGKSYTVEATHFQGSPLQITALQSGQIDIAALGFSSFSLAVENAGMSDLRIIADEIQWGVAGYGTADFAVLKDSPVKKVEDLKGKVLVTNGIGGGLDMIMKAEMLKHGMIDKRDFSVIEIAFPNMKSVLEEHKADLIPSTLPWSRNPAQAAISRTLFTTSDAMGHVALSFWVAHKDFLDKNRRCDGRFPRGLCALDPLVSRSEESRRRGEIRLGLHQGAGGDDAGLAFHQGR